MLCDLVSLFTKATRVPGDTVISVGLTPDEVMVIRVVLEPPLDPEDEDGEVGELPPQAATMTPRAATAAARASRPNIICSASQEVDAVIRPGNRP